MATSSSVRSKRAAWLGRMSSRPACVSCGLPTSPNSVRNASVTSWKTEPSVAAPAPSRLIAASGRFLAASASAASSFWNASVPLSMSSSTGLVRASST